MFIQRFFLFDFFLHTLYDFLGLGLIPQYFQQVDSHQIRVLGLLERILHPGVGLSAHIDKEITAGDFDDVIHCGLIAVEIHAAFQQHGGLRLVSCNPPDPVIEGENGDDHMNGIRG